MKTKRIVKRRVNKKFATVKDLCAIMEAAHKASVLKLKFRDIDIEFQTSDSSKGPSDTDYPTTYIEEPQLPSAPAKRLEEILDKDTLEEMHLSQVLIDDPMAFEQAQIDANLRRQHWAITNEETSDRRPE